MNRLYNRTREEFTKAREKFGPFNSTHEAYAVLKEETEEYWELVRKSKQDQYFKNEMIKELIQIAAVALRTAKEIESNEIKWI